MSNLSGRDILPIIICFGKKIDGVWGRSLCGLWIKEESSLRLTIIGKSTSDRVNMKKRIEKR